MGWKERDEIRRLIFIALLILLAMPVSSAAPVQTMSGTLEIVPLEGMLMPSGLDAEELRQGLKHDLCDLAEAFVEAERETGVNAAWLASIAALESGWGRSNLARERGNLFGWTGSDGYRGFESAEECVAVVASALREEYLTKGGRYHHGYEIEDVSVCYCPNPAWAETVRGIYEGIVRRCAG